MANLIEKLIQTENSNVATELIDEDSRYRKAQELLAGDKKSIQVFVGLMKNNDVTAVRYLRYFKPVERFDDVLATIVLRGRAETKILGTAFKTEEEAKAKLKPMTLEGEYELDCGILECPERQMASYLPSNVVMFYLDSKTQWRMISSCPEYPIHQSALVKDVFKDYYTKYYPKEVVELAFSDPSDIKRVYNVDLVNGVEDFYMESLFKAPTETTHVFAPWIEQNTANHAA